MNRPFALSDLLLAIAVLALIGIFAIGVRLIACIAWTLSWVLT